MTSLTCPKCRSHISEFDLNCINCGYSISQEEREKLKMEEEKQRSRKALEKIQAKESLLKQENEFKILKRLNAVSLGLFKVGWTEMVMPFVIVVIVIIVLVLMIL